MIPGIATLIEPVAYDRLATLKILLWAGGAVLAAFVLLCATAVLHGWLRSRQHLKLHRKADHIGRKDS